MPGGKMAIQKPDHPWVKHLNPKEASSWLNSPKDKDVRPWRAGNGECIIATPDGTSLLYRLPVGKGQLIYMGWRATAALPQGRTQATEAQESAFADQAEIVFKIAADISTRSVQAR
jgi:hypothetical protein